MEIFLLLTVLALVVITFGYFINKYLKMPWMFTAVLFGMILSSFGLFADVMKSQEFLFLSKIGMFFFLFTIGLDLDLSQIRKLGGYIIGGNILLTLTEGLLIASLLYFVFPAFVSNSFLVAVLCGIAFGTVGEVILLAILKEFGLEKTRFGQLALGIGVFDDIFEILVLSIIIALPAFSDSASQDEAWKNAIGIVISLAAIIGSTILLSKVGKLVQKQVTKIQGNSFVWPFMIFMVLFAFLYFGTLGFENLGVVAAIFAGITVNHLFPEKMVEQYKKPIFFVGNMFLGPFFFLSIGGSMSFSALLTYPLLVLAIMSISILARTIVSYLLFRKLLGSRLSVVMGIGLTAKFSTSVISENLLFTSGMIAQPLYSAIMAAFILLKPIIIGGFSKGLSMTKEAHEEFRGASSEVIPATYKD